jgi:hypothetical protein
MKAIIDFVDFKDVCTSSDSSIQAVLKEKSQRISKYRKHDSVYRAWHTFMKIWEEMNRYFSLNAGNLTCALEIMLSQLMFKFAHTNETWYVATFSHLDALSDKTLRAGPSFLSLSL